MYVCVCKAVTEREVHQAIRGGARSMRDLRTGLGVASECGRCATCARGYLRDAEQADSGTRAGSFHMPASSTELLEALA